MKVQIITEPFVPTSNEEFYYKPSEKWNYLVWCDKKYVSYFTRVYGEIPLRINPVKLNMIDESGSQVISDFYVELSADSLGDILDKGGKTKVKIKRDGIYLMDKKCNPR